MIGSSTINAFKQGKFNWGNNKYHQSVDLLILKQVFLSIGGEITELCMNYFCIGILWSAGYGPKGVSPFRFLNLKLFMNNTSDHVCWNNNIMIRF